MKHNLGIRKRLRTATALISALSLLLSPTMAYALPMDGQVAAGSAAMVAGAHSLDVNQTSERTIINWNSFDIAHGETVNFNQPSSSSIALNRIASGNASQILGNLNANGQVWLINPNGVVFGSTAQVNVGGLLATTSDIDDSRFMNGDYTFDHAGGPDAAITNAGQIHIADGGLAALVGSNVTNTGLIQAHLGKIQLGSGDTFALDLYGDGLINLQASAALTRQAITNSGTLAANGGQVFLTLTTAQETLSSLINLNGMATANNITVNGNAVSLTGTLDADNKVDINARTIAQQGHITGSDIHFTASEAYLDSEASTTKANGQNGGTIHVDGGKRVFSSGTYEAKGAQGGNISFEASDSVKLYAAHVDATGTAQGGTIRVGGGYQGKDTSIKNAQETVVNPATVLNASATNNGNGGSIIVWSQELTRFAGTAKATGGANGGNGGFMEISSKDVLDIGQYSITDASSAHGQAGSLLLDPHNITISNTGITSGALSYFEFVDPNADTGAFGRYITTLSSGNIVITDINDDFAAANAGAVYLFNGTTGGLISTLTGSTASDQVGSNGSNGVKALTNGNYVVASTVWDNGGTADAGAATWGNGTTGVAGVVSAANSLVGSHTNDYVGSTVVALTNGNYVVASTNWDNGGTANVGAVTWGNGSTGTTGAVGTGNSLYGSTASDQVGSYVDALTNGNYVVNSYQWDNGGTANVGAVTWGNGSSGTTGAVGTGNSLYGSTASDQVGLAAFGNGVTVLTNGNYVVASTNWDNGGTANVGAVTWGNGSTGTTGAVGTGNSLYGSTASDQVGLAGFGSGVTALTNGNYVIVSGNWDNGGTADAGAATWGNGSTGTTGAVSSGNSLVGSTASDKVGMFGFGSLGLVALTNGNYVVVSDSWDNGGTANVGAVTWGNGSTGTTGAVGTGNSLYGSTANDRAGTVSTVGFGSLGVTALTNGNYVVASSNWNNGGTADVGAVTWGNGSTGTTGAIGTGNSLYGSTASDQVGLAGFGSGVTVLTNGNYVVISSNWDNGGTADAGAVTWGNGSTGTTGAVGTGNSLYGSTASDQVGAVGSYSGVTALTNGNYVVASTNWDNGGTADAGAVTWGNGSTGTTGAVGTGNSLYGSTASDQVGAVGLFGFSNGIMALTNGNYVVISSNWDNGGIADAGAITWGDGSSGTTGALSSGNSLVGSTASDILGTGQQGATFKALSNGNYVAVSGSWDNGGTADAGAATLCIGTSGCTGTISSSNSIIGPSASAGLSDTIVTDTVNNRWIVSFVTAQRAYSASNSVTTPGDYVFALTPAADVNLHPSFITAVLNAGTNVTLQASNDITVTDAVTANNPGGNGGVFKLQAGRSILINASITTDNGNFTAYGNSTAADGVVDAQRDAGDAVITMANGTAINAGSGAVDIQLKTGAGNTNTAAGDITLDDITGATVFVKNFSASDDVILRSGAALTGSSAGTNITLVSGRNFTNSSGSSTPLSTGAGRWLVYSTNPASDTLGGMTASFRRFTCTYGGSCPDFSGQSGTGFLYSYTPTLTATPSAIGLTYGAAAPNLVGYSYGLTGYLASDSGSDNVTGTLTGTTTYTQGSNVGSYNVTYSSGSLASALGYDFSYANNATAITVGARAITVGADAQSATYGDTLGALTYQITSGSLYNVDTLSGALTTAGGGAGTVLKHTNNFEVSGSPYTITQGTLANSNYTITYNSANLTLAAKGLTITGFAANNKTYDGNNTASISSDGSLSGTVAGDTVSINNGSAAATFNNATVGVGKTVTASGYALAGAQAGNYSLSAQPTTTANVTKAGLTVTADDASKAHGAADPALTATISGFVNSEVLGTSGVAGSASLSRAAGETAGPYAITPTLGTLTASNYDFTTFTDGVFTISAASGGGGSSGSVDTGFEKGVLDLTGDEIANRSLTQYLWLYYCKDQNDPKSCKAL